MRGIGRLGAEGHSHNVTSAKQNKEMKANSALTQPSVNKMRENVGMFHSYAQIAYKKFYSRQFTDLTKKPPFKHKIKGPAKIPSNRH